MVDTRTPDRTHQGGTRFSGEHELNAATATIQARAGLRHPRE
jgi:hypothetical protein